MLVNDLYDLELPLASFAQGRVALLGDAAHAMTPNLGQGACAAIEDAAALVGALGAEADVAKALQAYDAGRRGPTAKLIRRSRQIGNLGQLDSRFAVGLRDTGLRAFGGIAKLLEFRSSLVSSRPLSALTARACVDDEGVVDALFGGSCSGFEGCGQFSLGVAVVAGEVDPDGAGHP